MAEARWDRGTETRTILQDTVVKFYMTATKHPLVRRRKDLGRTYIILGVWLSILVSYNLTTQTQGIRS